MSEVKAMAIYSFVDAPSAFRDPDEKWGDGKMELILEKLPETPEEWMEVQRAIGVEGKHAEVAIKGLQVAE